MADSSGSSSKSVTGLWQNGLLSESPSFTEAGQLYVNRDGFDLIWLQSQLQGQMATVEGNIRNIEANANLSDTEKMFSLQMAMNTWSAISNLRTNMLKSVSDTLKTVVRNVS
jgi:type III secretion apparatus needle protein